VIGSDSGGIPEAIIHEETGLIVPLNTEGDMDQERYVKAILSLVGDRQRCLTMGRSARLRAEELFSDGTTIKRMAEVFMSSMPSA
jgi:starch synthase